MKNKSKPSIDRVTVENLDVALRICGIKLDKPVIDKIIDIVELLEKKGDKTNLIDMSKLISEWNKSNTYLNAC